MHREIPSVAEGASSLGCSDRHCLSVMCRLGDDSMAESTEEQTGNAETVRTATDLAMERLNARLDALESENRELRSANQGLWAQLHPVQEQPVVAEAQPVSDPNADYKMLADRLGIKEQ